MWWAYNAIYHSVHPLHPSHSLWKWIENWIIIKELTDKNVSGLFPLHSHTLPLFPSCPKAFTPCECRWYSEVIKLSELFEHFTLTLAGTQKHYWWLVWSHLCGWFCLWSQNFGNVVGTYKYHTPFCECRWNGAHRWWGHLSTSCYNQSCLKIGGGIKTLFCWWYSVWILVWTP